MSLLLVLALCQTLSAGQATEAGDYEQLFHLFMEIAGKGDNIYSMQEYVQEKGLDLGDLYNKAKTIALGLIKGLAYKLHKDLSIFVKHATPRVLKAVNKIADRLSNEVRKTREDITGSYAIVSGYIIDRVDMYTAIAGKKIDELHEIGLNITKQLKPYNIGFDSTLEEILNFSAAASKNALKAANFSVVMGEMVFFVAFNTTLFLIEETIQDDIKKFRTDTFQYMLFQVGLPLFLGLLLASGPIGAPLVFGLMAESWISGIILAFIKKLIDLYFVKVIAKRSPVVHDTVQCFFSTRVGAVILMTLETFLALLVGQKVGGTLTPKSTNAEISVFKTKVQSRSFIETILNDVQRLKAALSMVTEYLAGMIQLWLFPEDDADYDINPEDCFAHVKNLTFEELLRFHMTMSPASLRILSGNFSE